jgi:hypothetical protein
MERTARTLTLAAALWVAGGTCPALASSGVFRCRLDTVQVSLCRTDLGSAGTAWSQCCASPDGPGCADVLECFRRAAGSSTFTYQASCFESAALPTCTYTVTRSKRQ